MIKPREEVEKEILEIVNRETRAWNAKDVDLLITVFHPDMVWPWPLNSDAHDPMKWVLVLGRFDAARWKKVWQELFDSHVLIHNQRAIRKIEFPIRAMAPLRLWTLILCGATATAKISIGKGALARSTAGWERNGK